MRKLTLIILAVVLLLATGCGGQPATTATGDLQITFIDVGQGDSILIQAPGGHNLLIDAGEKSAHVSDYLARAGIKQLDVIVATHPHSDHIGGMAEVLQKIPVLDVWTNGQEYTTKTFEDFLDAIDKSGAGYHEAARGDIITLGEIKLSVLNPSPQTEGDGNNYSVVLRLVYGSTSLLFMGDAETPAEKDILDANLNVKANILKLGHHASSSSSSLDFLKAVTPDAAVYFAGVGNPYGHPHAVTLEKLKQLHVTFYGTDVNGTIKVITDGKLYHITTEKG